MATFTQHYKVTFKGYLNHYFSFDVHNEFGSYYNDSGTMPPTDFTKYVYEKDGYLYIQGCRITNNKDGIRTIYSRIGAYGYNGNDSNESFIDCTFVIDSNGYVIVESYKETTNQVSRILSKIFGK